MLCIVEIPTLGNPKLDYWLINAKHDLGVTLKASLEELRVFYEHHDLKLTPNMYALLK